MTSSHKGQKGFTLIEMLTVITIAAVLAILSVPAVQGLGKAQNFDQSVYSFADALNLARSYAMANNTYVYVGLTELDCTQSLLSSPQNPGVGRVAMSIVATKDGTSDASSWSTSGANLTQVRQVQNFNFFHIAATSSSTPFLSTGTGNMARPSNISANLVTLMAMPASAAPATAYSLPLGSASGGGKYNFSNTNTQMICFNPQGGVLLNGGSVQWLEIDVQPMNGPVAPAAPTNVNAANLAALVVDGVTGSVTVYRP
ncbi:MAG TPA: prepilin-type N-terminal cleavage/methylation domain-containing protein [Candidatus Methylacidiphilales bacterium]|nr:prepilin-type N-terminal cleavage/methylation domain-containing protein [Candidatus Methylacidiphilales bacterium]